MDNTYTVGDETDAVQDFALSGKAKLEPSKGTNLEITVKSQEQTGRYRFDTSAGAVQKSEMAQKVSMILTVGGKAIPTDLEWNVKLEMQDDREVK